MTNEEIEEFMKIRLEEGLPEPETLDAAVRRAPKREAKASLGDKKLIAGGQECAPLYSGKISQKTGGGILSGAGDERENLWLPFPPARPD